MTNQSQSPSKLFKWLRIRGNEKDANAIGWDLFEILLVYWTNLQEDIQKFGFYGTENV